MGGHGWSTIQLLRIDFLPHWKAKYKGTAKQSQTAQFPMNRPAHAAKALHPNQGGVTPSL
jgi:hypothetical protein